MHINRCQTMPTHSCQTISTQPCRQQPVKWKLLRVGGVELQVWDGTSHPLHIQQPGKVAKAVLALLERA